MKCDKTESQNALHAMTISGRLVAITLSLVLVSLPVPNATAKSVALAQLGAVATGLPKPTSAGTQIKPVKLTKAQAVWWKKWQKAMRDPRQRAKVNELLSHETHQHIGKDGYPTGNGGAGWSGKTHGKYHHCFKRYRGLYCGAAQMMTGHFKLVPWSTIVKVAKSDKRLAWRMYAAQMMAYLKHHHHKTSFATLNTWGW